MKNLFGEVVELNYTEDNIKSDIEGLGTGGVYSKEEQDIRVDEFVEITEYNCNNAATKGVPSAKGKHISHAVQNHLSYADIRYVALDREHKIKLFKKLSELVIKGNKVKLDFNTADSIEFTISW